MVVESTMIWARQIAQYAGQQAALFHSMQNGSIVT